jgi:hypothetical protein
VIEIAILRADAQWFSSHAKDLVVAGKPFRFRVTGLQAEALQPYLVGADLRDVPRMGRDRLLRPILAVVLIAEGSVRPVRFEVNGDEITGSVPGFPKLKIVEPI